MPPSPFEEKGEQSNLKDNGHFQNMYAYEYPDTCLYIPFAYIHFCRGGMLYRYIIGFCPEML